MSPLIQPQRQAGEVLVKVHHAGINRADVLQRLGLYPPPEDASPIPGLEVGGEVVAVGAGCAHLKEGDRVCALTHGGGYASLAIAREDHCLTLPDTLTTEQGAALPEALLTVWYNVFERGGLTERETVLIHGGSSGIGSIGVQMARMMGATVISTAGLHSAARQCKHSAPASSLITGRTISRRNSSRRDLRDTLMSFWTLLEVTSRRQTLTWPHPTVGLCALVSCEACKAKSILRRCL